MYRAPTFPFILDIFDQKTTFYSFFSALYQIAKNDPDMRSLPA